MKKNICFIALFLLLFFVSGCSTKKYTITFESNGGSSVQSIVEPRDVQIEEPNVPTKEERTFGGWFIDVELTNPYEFTTMPRHNLTLYAKWEIKTYTITFESNGGSLVQSIVEPRDVQIEEPNVPTKEEHTFEGWFIDVELTNPYEFTTMPSTNLTLYAKWEIKTYTITFDSNGGSSVQSIVEPSNVQIEEPNVPTKEEHTFGGWYIDLELTNQYEFTTMPTHNLTLYAKWEIKTYTITFESNEGSIVQPIVVQRDVQIIEPSVPIKEGYYFVQWHEDSDLTTPYVFDTMPAEDITLYAEWDIIGTEGLVYEKIGNSYEVTEYHGSDSDVNIPKYYDHLPVQSIDNYAFRYSTSLTRITIPNTVTSIDNHTFESCTSLTSIIIPEGVTSIGYNAFSSCTSLTSIIISNTVTTIGDHAFVYCSSLTSIMIPEGVSIIGNGAFYYCESLTYVDVDSNNPYFSSIDGVLFNKNQTEILRYPPEKTATTYTIPDGVTSINEGSFSNCTSLTSIIIPEGVTSIGDWAFVVCSSLTSLILPNGVISMGENAFFGCSSLTSFLIPEGVTSIGKGTFSDCTSLTSIIIPEGVTSIGDWAFEICSSLTSLILPVGVISIGDSAFVCCSSLTSIIIPEGVASIGKGAFALCSSLTSITIPESVIRLGPNAFSRCEGLTIIDVDNNNPSFCSIDGVLFDKNQTEILRYPPGKIAASYTIPEGVTTIGNGAFKECDSLTRIIIPETVTCFGESVFAFCSNLTTINIPANVTSIGDSAFSYCRSLTSIILPAKITSISDSAFNNCTSLTSINIPANVTSISNSAFLNCLSLTSINIPESVTSIGYLAFFDCTSLTSIIIPEGVTRINWGAFLGCSALTIYCRAESIPNGWDLSWNSDNRPIVWGYNS